LKKTPSRTALSSLGEDRLIPLLTRGWAKQGGNVMVGPGDDCAVLRGTRRGERLLFKTDAVVEGVHFTAATPSALVGRKALGRALSDIAAMGGTPTHAVITLAVPPGTAPMRLAGIYRGLSALARRHGVNLVGGETTRAAQLLLSIALLGTIAVPPVLRSGGKAGDDLWVTGTLGATQDRKHLAFTPRLAEGQWLARQRLARAMMDLSDGLAADLPRLASASGTGFILDRTALPLARGATIQTALSDGEDYELLFAAAPRHRARLTAEWKKTFSTRLTRIGTLCARGKGLTAADLGPGFDHFNKAADGI